MQPIYYRKIDISLQNGRVERVLTYLLWKYKMRSLALFTFFLSALLPFSVFAQTHYAIVVDAGSTGSRAYTYSYEDTDKAPSIKVLNKGSKVLPGLATFAHNKRQVVAYIKPIIDDALRAVPEKDRFRGVPLYIYSTAGMRLISKHDQRVINAKLQSYFTFHYADLRRGGVIAKTISGTDEGVYAWISANYNHGSLFSDTSNTVGIVEVGGASTQVAYATDHTGTDIADFTLNAKPYHVFAHSFLSTGQTVTGQHISDLESCNPVTITPEDISTFDFDACRATIREYLAPFNMHSIMGDLPEDMHFYGLSGIYYTFKGFHVDMHNQGFAQLENEARAQCSDWQTFHANHAEEVGEAYVESLCYQSAYDSVLFDAQHYGISSNDNNFDVVSTINNQKVDWTMGVILLEAAGS